jgi:hypothetical protein
MSSNVTKSVKDSKRVLAEKEEEKINKKKADEMLQNAEDKKTLIKNWEQHIFDGDKIKSFTSIVNNQMYMSEPIEGTEFLPFSEYHGTYNLNWIINWDVKEKREIWRKNIIYVDLIEWHKPEQKS